jgi:hypothetical protein
LLLFEVSCLRLIFASIRHYTANNDNQTNS